MGPSGSQGKYATGMVRSPMSGQVWRRHAEHMLNRSGPYHDTLPQSEVVEVGEEVSEPDSVPNLPARQAISPQDIAVTISDATSPEQQQEPPGWDSGALLQIVNLLKPVLLPLPNKTLVFERVILAMRGILRTW